MAISVKADKETIANLGGPAKVADSLGYSIQRVQNWTVRGIPSKVKLEFPELFLKPQSTTPNNNAA